MDEQLCTVKISFSLLFGIKDSITLTDLSCKEKISDVLGRIMPQIRELASIKNITHIWVGFYDHHVATLSSTLNQILKRQDSTEQSIIYLMVAPAPGKINSTIHFPIT